MLKKILSSMSPDADIHAMDWKAEIGTHERYKSELDKIVKLYGNNAGFSHDVRATTEGVVLGKLRQGRKKEEAINEGVNFILEELSFLSASPEMFGIRVAYVYHDRWPVFEEFVSGRYDGKERRDLGFVVVR